jgi:chromosome segregation ATPase
MAFDVTLLIGAAVASLPGLAALYQARNQKRDADDRVDAAAFKAARDFYQGTLDEYKSELAQVRKLLKEARAELVSSKDELERARVDREFLAMRVTMLERDKEHLEKKIVELGKKLNQYNDNPTEDGAS